MLQRRIIAETLRRQGRVIPCHAGRLNLVLDERGELFPCEDFSLRLGNVRDHGFDVRATARSPQARAVLASIARGDCWCTHECYMMTNILFDLRHYPALLAEYLRQPPVSPGRQGGPDPPWRRCFSRRLCGGHQAASARARRCLAGTNRTLPADSGSSLPSEARATVTTGIHTADVPDTPCVAQRSEGDGHDGNHAYVLSGHGPLPSAARAIAATGIVVPCVTSARVAGERIFCPGKAVTSARGGALVGAAQATRGATPPGRKRPSPATRANRLLRRRRSSCAGAARRAPPAPCCG